MKFRVLLNLAATSVFLWSGLGIAAFNCSEATRATLAPAIPPKVIILIENNDAEIIITQNRIAEIRAQVGSAEVFRVNDRNNRDLAQELKSREGHLIIFLSSESRAEAWNPWNGSMVSLMKSLAKNQKSLVSYMRPTNTSFNFFSYHFLQGAFSWNNPAGVVRLKENGLFSQSSLDFEWSEFNQLDGPRDKPQAYPVPLLKSVDDILNIRTYELDTHLLPKDRIQLDDAGVRDPFKYLRSSLRPGSTLPQVLRWLSFLPIFDISVLSKIPNYFSLTPEDFQMLFYSGATLHLAQAQEYQLAPDVADFFSSNGSEMIFYNEIIPFLTKNMDHPLFKKHAPHIAQILEASQSFPKREALLKSGLLTPLESAWIRRFPGRMSR